MVDVQFFGGIYQVLVVGEFEKDFEVVLVQYVVFMGLLLLMCINVKVFCFCGYCIDKYVYVEQWGCDVVWEDRGGRWQEIMVRFGVYECGQV